MKPKKLFFSAFLKEIIKHGRNSEFILDGLFEFFDLIIRTTFWIASFRKTPAMEEVLRKYSKMFSNQHSTAEIYSEHIVHILNDV